MNCIRLLLSLAILFIGIVGCSDDDNAVNAPGNETLPDTVSFTTHVKPILTASCAKSGCHGAGSSAGGYSMGSVTRADILSASGTVGGLIVKVNDSTSTLYQKTTTSWPFGSRMPQDGPPFLSDINQLILRRWILQGAQDN